MTFRELKKGRGDIIMITINTNKKTSRDEVLAALTDSYLQLQLSAAAAKAAAEADLQLLDASELVAEAN